MDKVIKMSGKLSQYIPHKTVIGTHIFFYILTFMITTFFFMGSPGKIKIMGFSHTFVYFIAIFVVFILSRKDIQHFSKNESKIMKQFNDAANTQTAICIPNVLKILFILVANCVGALFIPEIAKIFFKPNILSYCCIVIPTSIAISSFIGVLLGKKKYTPNKQISDSRFLEKINEDALQQSIDDYYYGIFPIRYHEHQSSTDTTPSYTSYQPYDPHRPGGH